MAYPGGLREDGLLGNELYPSTDLLGGYRAGGDVFDDDYLDRIEERLDWAESAGLYVILDMHQDLYGEKFGGDGAPIWATRDGGIPYEPTSPWWLNYLTAAIIKAFHHFWYDADLQEHFLQSLIRVAQLFGDHPAVLGYEVLNEPFFGDISPLRFEKDVLYPFYRRIAEGLHSVDPDCVVFFEPMIITNVGLPSMGSPIGLANTVSNTVYTPHFYQAEVHEGHPYNGDPTLISNTMKREATKHKTPWILTEFGVAPATPAWDQYIEHLLSALDEHSAGWLLLELRQAWRARL